MGITSKNSPVRGDRLCVKNFVSPRWGLNGSVFYYRGCTRLCLVTPLPNDLVAPNGAVNRILILKNLYHTAATPRRGPTVGNRTPNIIESISHTAATPRRGPTIGNRITNDKGRENRIAGSGASDSIFGRWGQPPVSWRRAC